MVEILSVGLTIFLCRKPSRSYKDNTPIMQVPRDIRTLMQDNSELKRRRSREKRREGMSAISLINHRSCMSTRRNISKLQIVSKTLPTTIGLRTIKIR